MVNHFFNLLSIVSEEGQIFCPQDEDITYPQNVHKIIEKNEMDKNS